MTDIIKQPPKKLYRSRKDRMFAGVCGGLAEYFNIDSSIVRLLFVLFFFLGGCALLAYILMWLIVPLSPGNITAA
ncbi:MAG: PspC domain-containing protein [Gammaproteobacteria bacterium]